MIESYRKILDVVNSNKFGKVQTIIISTNTCLNKSEIKKKIHHDMDLFTSFLSEPSNSCVCFEDEPYLHGYLLLEFKNKELFRYTVTSYDGEEHFYITIYLSKGEIRYDSISNKVMTYIQKPDYEGDEVKNSIKDNIIDKKISIVKENFINNVINKI